VIAYDLGPRAQRVFEELREQIVSGAFEPGAKLPSHVMLAEEFGVAPMTIRQVLARLEREGLVSREQGRGTFVRRPSLPAVLILEDDPHVGQLLAEHVKRVGARPVVTTTPEDALAALADDPAIAFVFSDVRVPDPASGIAFIRTTRHRRPELPLAAVTAFPEDLSILHGTPESPVLIIAKPFQSARVREALRLGLGTWLDHRPRSRS
jgi:DNA-binding transcriptional regulator YhcF (GntR family)